MGLAMSPDVFQELMFSIFSDMPNVIVYQDDLMIASNGSTENHLHMLDLVLTLQQKLNLQVNRKPQEEPLLWS
jgi:hypothetical protein